MRIHFLLKLKLFEKLHIANGCLKRGQVKRISRITRRPSRSLSISIMRERLQ